MIRELIQFFREKNTSMKKLLCRIFGHRWRLIHNYRTEKYAIGIYCKRCHCFDIENVIWHNSKLFTKLKKVIMKNILWYLRIFFVTPLWCISINRKSFKEFINGLKPHKCDFDKSKQKYIGHGMFEMPCKHYGCNTVDIYDPYFEQMVKRQKSLMNDHINRMNSITDKSKQLIMTYPELEKLLESLITEHKALKKQIKTPQFFSRTQLLIMRRAKRKLWKEIREIQRQIQLLQ
jgi:Prophage protein (DUF1660)